MTPLEAAAEALGLPGLSVDQQLGGSKRSEVWRSSTPDGSVIVKHYLEPERRTWVREAAGLRAAQGVRTPRLLASREDPTLAVLSDLGDGPSLADALMGTDRSAAAEGVRAWATAIGDFHARTLDRIPAFVADLGDVDPHTTMTEVDGLAASWEELGDTVGVAAPARLAEVIADVAAPLTDPAGLRLSPGDTCPDNNISTAQGLHLIDFEFAEVRHQAWEAAYLRVPWPTCWCAWQAPPEVLAPALEAYRAAAGEVVDDFGDAVDRATLLWCFLSTSWFAAHAFDESLDHQEDDDRMPGRRTMVVGRLALAATLPGPPELTAYAAALRDRYASEWGDLRVAPAPAFRR